MNRTLRRSKIREFTKALKSEYKKLESHRTFILSLERLPEETLQLLKEGKYEENQFVQMYFDLVKSIHQTILSYQTAIAALKQKQ